MNRSEANMSPPGHRRWHISKNKVEEQFNTNNARSMWQGINSITGFKGNKPATVNIAASLPDELNNFYARFEADNTAHTESTHAAAAEEASALSISVVDVTRSFKRVNIRKAVGPNGIPGRVLRACAFQLAEVFTDIFNLSLSLSVVPSCFKKSTIVPIPKKNKITCMNDWRPVALTPIFSNCFERLIRDHICSVLPASLDPLQFAYRSNRSTDYAIAFTLHTALSHLENKNTFVRMLFVDYSSAFNTIVPGTLVAKLQTLGLNRSLCSWILDFLTGRIQVVRMGNNTSFPLVLNTGAPQGCVLSPLLYSLYTHDCTTRAIAWGPAERDKKKNPPSLKSNLRGEFTPSSKLKLRTWMNVCKNPDWRITINKSKKKPFLSCR